ncbi:MAG: tyrosine-type recombinase/integrase [Bifidobacteriaceae bacterium]|jgi:integrase|nr:tyrosine-type recombinase/integrase [Bifidobacteriaceae bacterium]
MYRLRNGAKRSVGVYKHKQAALNAATETEVNARKPGALDPRASEITWSKWRDIWWPSRAVEPQTLTAETSIVNTHIMPRWGDVQLAEIRRHDVQAWASGLLTEGNGHKASGVRRILAVLRTSLSAAIDADLLQANPATRIKLPPDNPEEPVFFTREQYAALVGAVPEHDQQSRAVLDFLVGTGVRWGELAGLHVHNFDAEGRVVTVADVVGGKEIKPYPKGRRLRRVPLMDWAVERLAVPEPRPCGVPHRHSECPSGLVFPNGNGGPLDNRNFTRRVWEPAVRAAGLAAMRPTLHDLRHTHASWLAQAGVPLSRIAQLLGHSSTRTTELYAHFAPATADDIRAALPPPRGANMGQASTPPRYARLRLVASK